MPFQQPIASVLRRRRPALRVQLTLLYSGLFLAVLAAVLLATNLLYGHTAARAPGGVTHTPVTSDQTFDFGPALLGLAAALAALAGAWWLAGRFLRPLHAITTTAQEISATNLNRRLGLTGPSDELTQLGATLDDLFARLEATFEAQRHFVANASHELRTPLTGQRTLLQVALADPKASTSDLRAACEEALQIGDQQEQLIDALLILATSERGIEHWEPFDLAQITQTVLANRQHHADQHGIHVDTSLAPAPAAGDPLLVTSLVANLIDNALHHNTDGGHITIVTTASADTATITITNTGPIVAQADLKRLLEPFQQTGPQRVRRNGHGLGLAIVLAIAEAHAARITADPRPEGGLNVEVSFRKTAITSR
jgi:signal transduction histidine kinase